MKTTLTRKQKIEKILDLIKKMEQNTFLLPDSWSEVLHMVSRSAHYKTYVGARNADRYINIEYTKNEELYNPKINDCYSITIRKNDVFLNKILGDTKNEINTVLDIIEAIYKEKISFELMEKEVTKKRIKMKDLRETIKSATNEFNKLKDELEAKGKIK
ncbi:MAG: hypothetical protein WCT36_06095 [Candidatus Gracilibacteria bacterium]